MPRRLAQAHQQQGHGNQENQEQHRLCQAHAHFRNNPPVLYTNRPRGVNDDDGKGGQVYLPLNSPSHSRAGFPPRRSLVRLGLLVLAACLIVAAHTGSSEAEEKLPRHAERWVKRTLERMTLEQKVGQLLMITYFGDFTSVDSPEYQRLTRQLNELH